MRDQTVELPPRTPGVGCPSWCVPERCSNEAVREGTLWHHGRPHVVEGWYRLDPTPLTVHANWIEKPEVHRGNDPDEFEAPMVTVEEADLDLTPTQARALAAALIAAADDLESAPVPA